jgi:hypothetical protein
MKGVTSSDKDRNIFEYKNDQQKRNYSDELKQKYSL